MNETTKKQDYEVKKLELELERIKNGGFPLPYEAFKDFPYLTEKTKKIIMRFAEWLSEKRIFLEICSDWEYGFLFSLFSQRESNSKLTKKQRDKLRKIILRCEGVKEDLSL